MTTTTSADGTTIGYDIAGSGPLLVLVDGAMCHRGGPLAPLAAELAGTFTVVTYDRRGRGESGDTPPYTVQREVEDLQAVVAATGGSAAVYGISSGAALAMHAAAGPPPNGITALALYEPPYLGEVGASGAVDDYSARLRALLAEGRRGDAAALFMTNVGVPAPAIDAMRASPGWPGVEAIAPTLAYDDAVLGDGTVPRDVAAAVTVPTTLLCGGASPDPMQQATKATADLVPGAGHRVLDGLTHDADASVLAPVLVELLG
jgi:alpha-beta hydrolase superfamily lysophospholipase